jgi:hypothetical protein
VMVSVTPQDVVISIERLINASLTQSILDGTCRDFERAYPHKTDDIDPLLLIMNIEELKDIGIGNPDDDFPFLREKNGRARCRSDLTLLQWCEEVAKWANKTHVNELGHYE